MYRDIIQEMKDKGYISASASPVQIREELRKLLNLPALCTDPDPVPFPFRREGSGIFAPLS
jgi:hypothetical protein